MQCQNLPLGPHFAPKGAFWAQKPGKTVRHRTFGAIGFWKPYRGTKGHGNFNLFYFCQFWAILRENQQKLVIFGHFRCQMVGSNFGDFEKFEVRQFLRCMSALTELWLKKKTI